MLTSIYDLAELAVTKFGLRGIDWAQLNAQGRGTVWDRDYITKYMLPAQVLMITTVGGMAFDVGGDPKAVQDNYSLNESVLQRLAESIVSLMNVPNPGQMMVEVGLSREAIRYLVSHAYQSANYAFLLHADETIHHSGMSDAEISGHADTAVGIMNALVMMQKTGGFKALGIDQSQGAPQPASGLGLAPLAIVAIAVVACAFLACCAWVWISVHDLNSKNAIVAKTCAQAQASGDAATTQQCINTLTDPNKNAGTMVPNAIKQTLFGLIPYAIGGVAIYALYLSAPYIVKNLLTKKATA